MYSFSGKPGMQAQDRASLKALMIATGNGGGDGDMWKQLNNPNTKDAAWETLAEQAAASGGAFVTNKDGSRDFISGSAIGGIKSQAQQAHSSYLKDDLAKAMGISDMGVDPAARLAVIKASLSDDDTIKAKLSLLSQDSGDFVKQTQANRIVQDQLIESGNVPGDKVAAKTEREGLTKAMNSEMNFVGKLVVEMDQVVCYIRDHLTPPGASAQPKGN
jgi:hypothetical protein